jgi:hypothetical protein
MPYTAGGVVMLIKINGGTPVNGNESLCETCVHSMITKGRRLEEELVLCEAAPMQSIRITFKVTSCTQYLDAREPSYHELLEHAWILKPASTRRPAGFVRASELRYDERNLPPDPRPKKF